MKRKPLIFILLCALFSIVLAGCDSGKPTKQEVEVVSPTGCLMSQARYYDPKLKDCVKVTSQQQAFELEAYRHVNRLAEGDIAEIEHKGPLTEAEYDIGFSTYISMEKAEALWAELRDQGGKMLVLSGVMPDDRGKDGTSKIWSGLGLPMGWQNFAHPDTKLERGTVNEMLLETIANLEEEGLHPELRKAILEDKDLRIYSMNVIVNPVVMRDFWNRHLDDIQGIQPRITWFDTATAPAFGPLQPYAEESE